MLLLHGLVERRRAVARLSVRIGPGGQQQIESFKGIAVARLTEDRRTKNLRAVQLLLGHTKLESTVRYLGIEVDDALELAEQTEV